MLLAAMLAANAKQQIVGYKPMFHRNVNRKTKYWVRQYICKDMYVLTTNIWCVLSDDLFCIPSNVGIIMWKPWS